MPAAAAPAALAAAPPVVRDLMRRFGETAFTVQPTRDGIPTLWSTVETFRDLLGFLKREAKPAYRMLFDLFAIDERLRTHRDGQPDSDFTLVYHLMSFDDGGDVRIKVPLKGESPSLPTITDLWPNANWYEREAWDMFGIRFAGHPNLRRILLPPTWQGHPLRKDFPARRT